MDDILCSSKVLIKVIVVHRMKKADIACPTVALLKKHILVMSFIGKDQQPAPKLKDAVLSPRQLQLAYEQCVQVQSDLIRVFLIEVYLSEGI